LQLLIGQNVIFKANQIKTLEFSWGKCEFCKNMAVQLIFHKGAQNTWWRKDVQHSTNVAGKTGFHM
jgi:hypothetical protein